MSKPQYFPPRKVLEVQRSLGLGGPVYACPDCPETFTQEPKFWLHAKENHSVNLGATGSSTEAERQERELWKQRAVRKAQDRITALKPPTNGRAGDYRGRNKLQSPTSPKRPSTAPEATEESAQSIGGSGQLSVGQAKTLSTDNPRKRGAGPGSISPDSPGQAKALNHPKARHTKARSSGQAIDKDPEFQREKSSAANPGSQRLFDHQNDDLASGNLSRNPRVPRASYRIHHHSSKAHDTEVTRTVPYESLKDDGSRPSGPPKLGAAGPTQILQPKPNKFTKSTHPVDLDRPSDPNPHAAPVDEPDTEEPDDPEPDTLMLRQPETRPISHDQLVVEVKGIYAGLVMVEAKCIDVDEKQTGSASEDLSKKTPLTDDQWRSLIALHKQLLHEHHDFFLASQHPSASSNLSKLAAKYSMAARMWRHGIHAFLEVLRHGLPKSLEHMLAFIYISYSMIALLYETVPTFEDTWIECLGDLGRYRMAIEDDEPKDREVWSGVAKYWYSKASDKSPAVGRLYHHLAILARPYTLEQLSLYSRSLTCVTPFESARGSIMTLLNPILAGRPSAYHRAPLMETLGIKAHAILFTYPQRSLDEFRLALKQLKESAIHDFLRDFQHNAHKLKRVGAYFAVSNIAAMLEYGASTRKGSLRSVLAQAFEFARTMRAEDAPLLEAPPSSDTVMRNADEAVAGDEVQGISAHYSSTLAPDEAETSSVIVSHASDLTFSTLSIAISERYWESKYLTHLSPLVHVMMVFIWSSASVRNVINHFEERVPWAGICLYLNKLAAQPGATTSKVFKEEFPKPDMGVGRPLWEDFILRGLLYTRWYFPGTWFSDAGIDDEERQLEAPSMDATRMERVLWLGHRIASLNIWIWYNLETKSFEITERFGHLSKSSDSKPTSRQDSHATPFKIPDSLMPDAPTPIVASSDTSIAPSEAPESSTISSPPTTATGSESEAIESPEGVTTPKATVAEEYDDDVPMIDVSPSRDAVIMSLKAEELAVQEDKTTLLKAKGPEGWSSAK
ncbi:MAG: hypothetical protein Q9217_005866 [Psora testacea]